MNEVKRYNCDNKERTWRLRRWTKTLIFLFIIAVNLRNLGQVYLINGAILVLQIVKIGG